MTHLLYFAANVVTKQTRLQLSEFRSLCNCRYSRVELHIPPPMGIFLAQSVTASLEAKQSQKCDIFRREAVCRIICGLSSVPIPRFQISCMKWECESQTHPPPSLIEISFFWPCNVLNTWIKGSMFKEFPLRISLSIFCTQLWGQVQNTHMLCQV